MQKMLYKKNANSTPEVVWMINAYKALDGHLKAVIMRKLPNVEPNGWDSMPYDEVKLSRLRPFVEDYNKVFAKISKS